MSKVKDFYNWMLSSKPSNNLLLCYHLYSEKGWNIRNIKENYPLENDNYELWFKKIFSNNPSEMAIFLKTYMLDSE